MKGMDNNERLENYMSDLEYDLENYARKKEKSGDSVTKRDIEEYVRSKVDFFCAYSLKVWPLTARMDIELDRFVAKMVNVHFKYWG